MRVALDRLVHSGLASLVLVFTIAPLAHAQQLIVTDVETVEGPLQIARARTQVEGPWNLEYVHFNQLGVDTAEFDWINGQSFPFEWISFVIIILMLAVYLFYMLGLSKEVRPPPGSGSGSGAAVEAGRGSGGGSGASVEAAGGGEDSGTPEKN